MNTAFISYSRADISVAIDLVKKLEKYPYPMEMVSEENRPYHPKFVRPVFLDVLNLPVKVTEFNKDIQDNLRKSRYLVVICSEESSKSSYVKKEIDLFSGMHPIIDKIVATRNCPIYVSGRGEAGRVGRKYCFYHLLEFILKVDFDKLYNRYEAYKRRKRHRRNQTIALVVLLIIGTLVWALISQINRVKAEHQQTKTIEAKV